MPKKKEAKESALAESFLTFQIELKSKEIERFEDEVMELEAKNQQLVNLLEQQKKKQQEKSSKLREQVREQDKTQEYEAANEKEIAQAVQHNQECEQFQEKELEELYSQSINIQAQVVELQLQRQVWQLYKEVGSVENQQKIENLLSEINYIKETFQVLSETIECSLKEALSKIDKRASQLFVQEKQLAKQRALKQVDVYKVQKIKKNTWLKKMVALYDDEVSTINLLIQTMEEQNLEHMKHLFDQHNSDVQTLSNAFLTQTEDSEQKHRLSESAAETAKEQPQQCGRLEDDEMAHSCKPSSTHHLSTLLYGSQGDLREPPHLGPLEQTLLSVVGQAMPLYPLPSDPEELKTLTHQGLFEAPEGTLTTKIIRTKFN